MTAKSPKPPKGEQFIKLPRDLLRSDAWRSQSINCRRLIDFLMEEHMAHGGAENGKLKAPYRQLEAYGVGARYCADAIREAEDLGLVNCDRGGKRVATTYTLTWLPLHNGGPVTHRWHTYRNAELKPIWASKIRNLPSEGSAGLPPEGKAEGVQLPREGKAESLKTLPSEGRALSRSSYQDGAVSLKRRGAKPRPTDKHAERTVVVVADLHRAEANRLLAVGASRAAAALLEAVTAWQVDWAA